MPNFTLVLRTIGTDPRDIKMLEIPTSEVHRLSTAPLRWLCAVGYAITRLEAPLFGDETEVDYDDKAFSGGQYYYMVNRQSST